MYIKRHLKTSADRAAKGFPSILITGPRQSGKTTFLKEEYGRRPNIVHPEQRSLWLASYIRTYLQRDVRDLQQTRNLSQFEQFIGILAASHGQELEMSRLSRLVGRSQPGVKKMAIPPAGVIPDLHASALSQKLCQAPENVFH